MDQINESTNPEEITEGLITDPAIISSLTEAIPADGYAFILGNRGGYEWSGNKYPSGTLGVAVNDLIGEKWKAAPTNTETKGAIPFAHGYFQGTYWKFWKRQAPGELQPAFMAQKMMRMEAATAATQNETVKSSVEIPKYGDLKNLTGFSVDQIAGVKLLPSFTYGSEEEYSAELQKFEGTIRDEITKLTLGNKNWLHYELTNAYFGVRNGVDNTISPEFKDWASFFKELRMSDFSPSSRHILYSGPSSAYYYLGWLKTLADDSKMHGENRKAYMVFSALVKALYGDQLPFPYAKPVTEEEILAGKLNPEK